MDFSSLSFWGLLSYVTIIHQIWTFWDSYPTPDHHSMTLEWGCYLIHPDTMCKYLVLHPSHSIAIASKQTHWIISGLSPVVRELMINSTRPIEITDINCEGFHQGTHHYFVHPPAGRTGLRPALVRWVSPGKWRNISLAGVIKHG